MKLTDEPRRDFDEVFRRHGALLEIFGHPTTTLADVLWLIVYLVSRDSPPAANALARTGTGLVLTVLFGPIGAIVNYLLATRRREGPVDDSVFFSSRRRHTRFDCDWSSDVCSSD